MPRYARSQGAIVRNHHTLLIKHTNHTSGRNSWRIPGGGIAPGAAEEADVARALWEETNLRVRVERRRLDAEAAPGGAYQRRKTYLCSVESGEARPGYAPEPEAAAVSSITAVAWFDLRARATWPEERVTEHSTGPLRQNVRTVLGSAARSTLEARSQP